MTPRDVWDFMRFWELLRGPKGGLDKETTKALRARLDKLSDKSLASYTEFLQRRYEEQQAGADSVASRGGSLFVFVGILTTGATLLAGLATPENPWLFCLVLAFGFCLFYATFAAAFLAVRSQQVSVWAVPSLTPEDGTAKRALGLTLAAELMAAVEYNEQTHRNLVAYLRDGQLWARLVLFFVVVLAAIVVVANAVKPTAAGASTTPSPVSTPASYPSAAVTLTPTGSNLPSIASRPWHDGTDRRPS
jgi:hypothetical protein